MHERVCACRSSALQKGAASCPAARTSHDSVLLTVGCTGASTEWPIRANGPAEERWPLWLCASGLLTCMVLRTAGLVLQQLRLGAAWEGRERSLGL
eukprot:13896177-Alexandrium_andersonii.AAC.1